MIEDIEAARNLDDILQALGADVLHVASDLGQSLGNPGSSEVRRVKSEVIPRIRAGGKFVGVGGNNPADTVGVAEFINQGANFVTVSAWGLLRIGAEDFLNNVEAGLKNRRSSCAAILAVTLLGARPECLVTCGPCVYRRPLFFCATCGVMFRSLRSTTKFLLSYPRIAPIVGRRSRVFA